MAPAIESAAARLRRSSQPGCMGREVPGCDCPVELGSEGMGISIARGLWLAPCEAGSDYPALRLLSTI
jgi:hypothetical protein